MSEAKSKITLERYGYVNGRKVCSMIYMEYLGVVVVVSKLPGSRRKMMIEWASVESISGKHEFYIQEWFKIVFESTDRSGYIKHSLKEIDNRTFIVDEGRAGIIRVFQANDNRQEQLMFTEIGRFSIGVYATEMIRLKEDLFFCISSRTRQRFVFSFNERRRVHTLPFPTYRPYFIHPSRNRSTVKFEKSILFKNLVYASTRRLPYILRFQFNTEESIENSVQELKNHLYTVSSDYQAFKPFVFLDRNGKRVERIAAIVGNSLFIFESSTLQTGSVAVCFHQFPKQVFQALTLNIYENRFATIGLSGEFFVIDVSKEVVNGGSVVCRGYPDRCDSQVNISPIKNCIITGHSAFGFELVHLQRNGLVGVSRVLLKAEMEETSKRDEQERNDFVFWGFEMDFKVKLNNCTLDTSKSFLC